MKTLFAKQNGIRKKSLDVLYSDGNTVMPGYTLFFDILVKKETPCFPHQQALVLVSANRLERNLTQSHTHHLLLQSHFFKKLHHEGQQNVKFWGFC